MRVLAVDDLSSNLLITRNLLAACGLQADTAASGREAIELVRKNNYDLILMDHMMPEMDGVETAAAIRKLETENDEPVKNGRQAPIIAMTANDMRGMREFYLEKGFQDYLLKPINPEALNVIINKWMGERGMENKNPTSDSRLPTSLALEIMARKLDMLNHYLVSFTGVPEADWRAKFDAAYFERFTALINSLVTPEMPAALREQAELLAGAGRKEETRKIRETLPAFRGALQKWREQEQMAAGSGSVIPDEILPKLKKALLAGETGTAETAIGELGEAASTPAWRELYFRLYALMLEGDTEKIMEAVNEVRYAGGRSQ